MKTWSLRARLTLWYTFALLIVLSLFGVNVMCAQCHEETTVPFYPSQGRPVYCRACFVASRAMTASA